MRKITLLLLLFDILVSQNILIASHRPKSALNFLPFHTIKDFYTIAQDPSFYAKQIPKVSYSHQLALAREYKMHFFAPWHQKSFHEPWHAITWAVRMFKRPVFRSSRRLFNPRLAQKIIKNANFQALNSVKLRAITIRHSNLRSLPTLLHAYRTPWKSTQGFPFDYLQNSAIEINTPLFISHFSLDKKWALVHAPGAFGWILTKDIALVDTNFIQQFEKASFGVVIKDNSLLLSNGKRVTFIKLGALFPKKNGRYFFASKNKKGYAILEAIDKVNKNILASFPLPFTPKNVAFVAKQLKGEPYGWGGICYGRDCSATTQDFFAVFGQFLYRTSKNQLKNAASIINIKPFKGRAKKDMILSYAKPFCSLLYVPGHIGIYIGRYKNEPIIMHTYWGVRKKDFSKYILARTIITTLEPGRELPFLRHKSKMANTLQKIINLKLCN